MDVYENNMYCIKNYRENLYNQISRYKVSDHSDNIFIESVDTRDGNRAISIAIQENTYRLNSLYNPKSEAVKWIEQFSFANLNIVISMFGLGNGIFAKEVIRKISAKDIVILYEPSYTIFEHVLKNYDLTDILSNLQIIIIIENINDLDFEGALIKYVDWTNMNSQKTVYHPQYDVIFKESYNYYIDKLKSHKTTQIVNRNTAAILGESVTRNTISNIKHIEYSYTIADYYKAFPPDALAIIVGAGPSLDKNIEQLKRAKGKAIIFATDTSLKYLFAHNIIPDFIVTLDAQKSMEHFSDERWKTINLLCSIESNPVILNNHKGRKVFFNIGKYLENLLLNLGKKQLKYTSGGSVATACFSVCANIGFKRIVLIGQDLAYQGDLTHAGGVVKNVRNTGINTLMVEDNHGDMIKSRYDWYSYILWFNNAITICKERDIEVINATEGGAKLSGATLMTLSDVVDQYCNISVNCDEIDQLIEHKFEKDDSCLLKEYLENSIKDLTSIEKKSNEASEICKKLIKAVKQNQLESYTNQALVSKITNINKFIQDKTVYSLIDDFILSVTTTQLGEINILSNDKVVNQINTYKRSMIIYDAIKDAARKIIPLLKDVEESMD